MIKGSLRSTDELIFVIKQGKGEHTNSFGLGETGRYRTNVNLTDDQQVKLAGMIGLLRDEGEQGISRITSDTGADNTSEYLKGSFLWHMDGTHDQVPVFGSLLSGRVLSNEGRQTYFAKLCACFESIELLGPDWPRLYGDA